MPKGFEGVVMKSKMIKTKLDFPQKYELGGWYDRSNTYIGVWEKDTGLCVANLGGYKLYRLAKAIVKQFEGDQP